MLAPAYGLQTTNLVVSIEADPADGDIPALGKAFEPSGYGAGAGPDQFPKMFVANLTKSTAFEPKIHQNAIDP